MSSRLTLSWVHQDRAPVPNGRGGYVWVDRDDARLTEVRLLRQTGRVGEAAGAANGNLLVRGDSYHAVHALLRTPEYAPHYRGAAKLVYLDPPFNTRQAFPHYGDTLEHSVWLGMMRERMLLIRELLAPDGSVWVHLDDAEMAYCRVMMDEVFGRENFVASVIWKRRNDPRNTATHISADHDFILCYARDIDCGAFNHLPRTETMDSAYSNPDNDPRGPWRRGDLAARNYYSKGRYPVTTPSGRVIPGPPSGSYWRVSAEELDRLDADHRVYWGPDGASRPYLKRYLTEVRDGRVPSSVWHPEEVGFVRNGKEEVRALVGDVFATPKPERLMQRVLHIATNPGDLVVDCFGGSGTTAAVAHKMGRRWVTVELSAETVDAFTRPRLERVVRGEDPGGVTRELAWAGGGGFRTMEVAPSLYEQHDGRVRLAPWARAGEFARAVAAQLGFVHAPHGPFAGHTAAVRLAVVDGVADAAVLRSLAAHLGPEDGMTVVAKGVAPGAAEVLRAVGNGSRVLEAPADLLRRAGGQPTIRDS